MQRIFTTIALGLIIGSCSAADRQKQAQSDTNDTRPSGPIAIEWTDGDLEKDVDRIGYGPKPESILARQPDGLLVFTPQTAQDLIATQFIPIQTYDSDRSLDLVLDVKTPGGEGCVANLQDQAYNVLGTVACRTTGEQRAAIQVPPAVRGVRLYFQSANLKPLQLPARVRLTEHR